MGFFNKKKKIGLETYGEDEVKKERIEKAKALMKEDLGKFKTFGKNLFNKVAPPKSASQIEYEKKLQKARTEAYQKESLRQAKISGRKAALKNSSNSGLPPLPDFSANFFDVAKGQSKGKKKQKKFRTGVKELDDLDKMMGM